MIDKQAYISSDLIVFLSFKMCSSDLLPLCVQPVSACSDTDTEEVVKVDADVRAS